MILKKSKENFEMNEVTKTYLSDLDDEKLENMKAVRTAREKLKLYQNQIIGSLKLLDIDYEASHIYNDKERNRYATRIYCKVECQLCSNKTIFSTRLENIFNQHCKSCGCLSNREDATERDIKEKNYCVNNWIIKRVRRDLTKEVLSENNHKRKYVYVDCICPECKNEVTVLYENIRRNTDFQKSCGCAASMNEEFFNNIIGKRFGRLIVTKYLGFYADESRNKKTVHWIECECDCGNTHVVEYFKLIRGGCQSCGCFRSEIITKHNLNHEILYSRWRHMNRRCYEPSDDHYSDYGARGIYVSDEWIKTCYLPEERKRKYTEKELNDIDRIHYFNFESYIRNYCERVLNLTLEEAIEKGYTNDRIDVDGPYAPWNCRYVTATDQSRNKVKSLFVNYKGYQFSIVSLLEPFFGIIGNDKNEYGKLFDKLKKRDFNMEKLFEDYPEYGLNLDSWIRLNKDRLPKQFKNRGLGLKLLNLGFSLIRNYLDNDNNRNLYCYKPEWKTTVKHRLDSTNIVTTKDGRTYIRCGSSN